MGTDISASVSEQVTKESQFNAHFTNLVRKYGHGSSINSLDLHLPSTQPTGDFNAISAAVDLDFNETEPYDPLDILHSLEERQKKRVEEELNPLAFISTSKLFPMKLNSEITQVLEFEPEASTPGLEWKYTFAYHGTRTHEWSLLTAQSGENPDPVCPIAVLNTWSSNAKSHECTVIDLIDSDQPRQFKMSHFWDSYANNGTHIGFQLDSMYKYEWKYANSIYNTTDLYLWQIPLTNDANPVIPVARIKADSLFFNPVDSCRTWCVEINRNCVDQHLALVSAFYLKTSHVNHHAFFAPKTITLEPASELNGLGFEYNRHLYRNVLGRWEEYPSFNKSAELLKIKVFGGLFFSQYKLVPRLVSALEREMKTQLQLQ